MTLETANLTLSYDTAKKGVAVPVLVGADLRIVSGEVLVIQGPNGSGKSTLMRAMARQLKPAAGMVSLDGQDIWQINVQHFARKVAFVPQSLQPPPAMTVYELVALGRAPHQKIFQLSPSEHDEIVLQKSLQRCGVEHLKDKKMSTLSGGEKQRAIIAMALSQEPRYLLLDEPTASLDFRHQLELLDLLGQLKVEGLGICLILHDLNFAAGLADRVALLSGSAGAPSTIVAQGEVKEVYSRETLQRVFAVDIEVLSNKGRDLYVPIKLK